MKKLLTVLLVAGIITAALGFVLPFAVFDRPDIIGGAGLPTMRFYMRTTVGQIFLLMQLFGCAGIISWGASRLMYTGFSPQCSYLTLGASASVAAVLSCLLLFAGCFIMTSPSRHPIALPASIIGGCASLLMLWIFTKQLIVRLKAAKSKKAVLLSAIIFTTHLIPFVYLFSFAYSLLQEIIK